MKNKSEKNIPHNINEIKENLLLIIDKHKDEIIDIGRNIYKNPELGYKETYATNFSYNYFKENLKLKTERNIAITGSKAIIEGKENGVNIAVLGEMDSIKNKNHKDSKDTGEVHGCGHNIQLAAMLGVAKVIKESKVMEKLKGSITFMAVPAEEYIEIDFKEKLKKEKKLTFYGGKQELIKRGHFDFIDMAMMIHAYDTKENKAILKPESNGFIGKNISYLGKEAHAGLNPEEGINALSAAIMGINGVNALRETFKEKDKVRFHPIITKGGDSVNVVPGHVKMESFVRAKSVEAMEKYNKKVNRALKAGADAIGCKIEIKDTPGYLPIKVSDSMTEIYKDNLKYLGYENEIKESLDFTGSFDFGDLTHIMPGIHPLMGGIKGSLHSNDFQIVDEETAYILPVKVMTLTIIDLLYNNNEKAKGVLKNFDPIYTKKEYLEKLSFFDQKIN